MIWRGMIFLTCLAPLLAAAEDGEEALQARAQSIARSYLLADTHIDAPYRVHNRWADVTRSVPGGEFDLPRAREGGLDIPFMSIYTPARLEAEGGSFQLANELIDSVEAMAMRSAGAMTIVRTAAEAQSAFEAGIIGLALGMENGSPIDHDLANVKFFRDRGISYITLAHSLSNQLSDSSYDENRPLQGLSDFGREVVAEMNRLGMMIDISHVSDAAFFQVVEISRAPLIASHSSARHFTPGFERNMSDEMIIALAKGGGVIQINFGSSFLTAQARTWSDGFNTEREHFSESRGEAMDIAAMREFSAQYRARQPFPFATLDQVLDHFDHVVKLVGIDHVGIGSDYDGVGDSLPIGLKDVSQFPNLIAGLLRRGYSEGDIAKIMGGNLMRVWRQVEEVAAIGQ